MKNFASIKWPCQMISIKSLSSICLIITAVILVLLLSLSLLTAEFIDGKIEPFKFKGLRYSPITAESQNCNTSGCIEAAILTKSYLDDTIDPCENFYQFACGNYMKITEIPDGKGMIDTFSTLGDLVQEQLHEVLSENRKTNESRSFQLARDFHLACLNESIIEKRDLSPLITLLDELGGWPVVKGDHWFEDAFDWVEMIKRFRYVGLDTQVIFSLYLEPDLKNTSKRILYIDEGYYELEREYLINGFEDETVQKLYESMIDSAIDLNANEEQAKIDMKEALEFEIMLANISLPREERRNGSTLYNPYTIKELQELYPYLNWLDYINTFLPNDLQIDENEIIINTEPIFFEQLAIVLNETSKRTLANYLLWRVVLTTSTTLTDEFREHQLENSGEPRWKECIQLTSQRFPITLSLLYARKYYDKELINAANEYVEDIRDALIDILTDSTWLDNDTQNAAIKKAKAIKTFIGYPNETIVIKLDEYYKDLKIQPDNFFANILQLEVFDINKYFQELREPVEKLSLGSLTVLDLADVNAYNQPNENSIQFPPTIFQGLFFSLDRPRYMNFGTIGSIIGHEMTHSFDDEGRQFDFDGNMVDWWNPHTEKLFMERAQCMIEQYGNFSDTNTNLTLNGINTQGENIADNGGTKQAYYAYRKWIQRNGPEDTLPGVKYSQTQMFWIAYAHSWCAVYSDDYIKDQIIAAEHAPNEFRVNGVVINMPKDTFAYDFNCPVGSQMNPANKCTIW